MIPGFVVSVVFLDPLGVVLFLHEAGATAVSGLAARFEVNC